MLTKNIAPTPEMVKIVTSILDNNIKSQEIDFNGKKYTISIENGKCVSLTRDDKKWYKSVCDFFSRGLTSGQSAFTPRAYQLKIAVDNQLLEMNKDTKIGRFSNIPAEPSTMVDPNLHANNIIVDGKYIGIASQYPKDDQIKDHLTMLADNRTPCLLVLAGDGEVGQKGYTDYFRQNTEYSKSTLNKDNIVLGSITQSEFSSFNIVANNYLLKTKDSQGKMINIPVVHVTNWPDKKTVPITVLKNMVELVKKQIDKSLEIYKKGNSRALKDPKKMLPVVHCKAGVGRTGVFFAEYAMSNDNEKKLSLDRIINDMRASRNNLMVQTLEQRATLEEICKSQNRPILKSDEKYNSPLNEPIYANIS